MSGVLAGYATIVIVIGVGALLAQFRVIDLAGQATLSALSFYIASPALLATVLMSADLGEVFSGQLVATTAAVLVVAAVWLVYARVRRHDLATTAVGALASGYVNAGNLGIPIAVYVLGDAALVAPTMLLQVLILQPLVLTVLDLAVKPDQLTLGRVLSRPFRNPITVGSGIGVLLALIGVDLPAAVEGPLETIAQLAVPAMLLAYGVALRLGPLPGRDGPPADLAVAAALKLALQPVVAYLLAEHAFGLDRDAVYAVTVLAALPTAQNVFIIASHYHRATLFARDAIFISTVCSPVAVFAVAALFHR